MKGNRAHVCFNLFDAYQKKSAAFHRELFRSLLDQLLPDRIILSDDLPVTSRASLPAGMGSKGLRRAQTNVGGTTKYVFHALVPLSGDGSIVFCLLFAHGCKGSFRSPDRVTLPSAAK